MLNVAIEETAYDRRVAFRARDFVVVIQERGWSDFHRNTPELRQRPAQNKETCGSCGKEVIQQG